jgi:hypothetical protein
VENAGLRIFPIKYKGTIRRMKEIKKYSSITSTCIMEFEKDASNKKVKKEYFMASRTRPCIGVFGRFVQ